MKYIIANWKSNKSQVDVVDGLQQFCKTSFEAHQSTVIIAPSFPFLSQVAQFSNKVKGVELAVQDLSSYPAGSYTGATSVRNVKDYQVKYAVVGHSERRRYFKETDQEVANKVERCVEADITPIVCVDDDYIFSQASAIKNEYLEKCLVAYEALAAIGSGHSEPVDEVKKAFSKIKQEFGDVPVIYGGSVTQANVSQYLEISDGVLVGGASLKVKSFVDIFNRV